MATEKDLKYTLEKLVKAIDGYTDAVNAYPLTKKTFEHLQKMDLELQTAMSLAKDLIDKGNG